MRQSALAAAACVLCWSLVASAQDAAPADTQLAEQHFTRGYALAEAHEYDAAAVEFEQAYQKSPHTSVLYNLGVAYAMAGKHVQAVPTLRRFLAEAGGADAALVERARAALRKSERHVGSLQLTVTPGASVMLDGQAVTNPSEPQVLTSGTHGVWAQAPGYRDGYRSFVVNAGGVTRLEMQLEPLPAAPAADEPAPALPKPAHRHLPPQEPPSHLWSYVLGGTGLALGAGAIALYVHGSAEHRELQDRRDRLAEEHTSQTLNKEQREKLAQIVSDSASQQRWDDVAVGLGICASVSLGTAIALLWRDSPGATERAAQVSFDGRNVSWSTTW